MLKVHFSGEHALSNFISRFLFVLLVISVLNISVAVVLFFDMSAVEFYFGHRQERYSITEVENRLPFNNTDRETMNCPPPVPGSLLHRYVHTHICASQRESFHINWWCDGCSLNTRSSGK